MKTLFTRSLLVLCIAAGATQAENANDAVNTTFNKHTFGAQIAAGSIEYKGNSNDDNGVYQLYTYYNTNYY